MDFMTDKKRQASLPMTYTVSDTPPAFMPKPFFVLHLISCRNMKFVLNDQQFQLSNGNFALCLNYMDRFQLMTADDSCCHSLSFLPTFVNSQLTIENLRRNHFDHLQDCHDRDLMYHFLHIDRTGLISLRPDQYETVISWMNSIQYQLTSQTDWWWTCRIRRFFIQIMYSLDEIYFDYEKQSVQKESPAETAIRYIHNNYFEAVSLETLCNLTNTNRTSLSKDFKKKTGLSPINYLISYRINIAKQLLTHTNLSLKEIADATGYHYESQFSKVFLSRTGMRPGEYRKKHTVSRSVFLE